MVYIEVKNHGRNITYVILLASDNRGGNYNGQGNKTIFTGHGKTND